MHDSGWDLQTMAAEVEAFLPMEDVEEIGGIALGIPKGEVVAHLGNHS